MDEKNKPTSNTTSPEQSPPAAEPDQSSVKKVYKSPTIKRHGNLRLMTQLE